MFGPVSGAHFNPVVSLVDASFGGLSLARALAYIAAQITGCILGAFAANGMFALSLVTISTQHRASPARISLGDHRDAGLLLVIFSLARTKRGASAPAAVGAYIGAAYFFTAPPASPTRRSASANVLRHVRRDRAGLRPASSSRSSIGGAVAIATIRTLYPDVTPDEAADVILPHAG